MVQWVRLDELIPKQVQVLQAQLSEVTRQHSQVVMRRRQVPQLRESVDVERQTDELVVVQFEVHQFSQLAELSGEGPQTIVTEVQELQGPLQSGQAEGHAEGFQVVIVEDEITEAAEVANGGREFLDVVIAEV